MAVTRAQVETRLEQAVDAMSAGMTTRSCTLLGMVTAGGYTWPLAYWMAGGTVILNMTPSATYNPPRRISATMCARGHFFFGRSKSFFG